LSKKDTFSYSKLNTYLQCPFKYDKVYNEKIKREKQSIESYTGDIVHQCLESLYSKNLDIKKLNKLYDHLYDKNFNDEKIFAVRDGTYKEDGKYLINYYYNNYYKFDTSITLATEYKISGEIANVEFIGYIDRVSKSLTDDNIYYINDYKTGKSFKKLNNDLQAQLYTKLAHNSLGNGYEIINRWFYLKHSTCEMIKYNEKALDNIEIFVKDVLNQIENDKEFRKIKTPLCNWCEIKELCDESI